MEDKLNWKQIYCDEGIITRIAQIGNVFLVSIAEYTTEEFVSTSLIKLSKDEIGDFMNTEEEKEE